jgi:spore maturation protein CgeB
LPVNELPLDFEATEIMYTGMSYVNSWGYKKAMLMNQFTSLNFKLYGNSMWKRWFRFFPQLESHYIESGFIPTVLLNKMFNKTKLIPVDGNPAILNGFHLRLFEALGSGALPLTEYRKDIETLLFKNSGIKIPLIKDYNKASDLANYYLKNESERKETVHSMNAYVLQEYSVLKNAERLLEFLDNMS